MRKLTTVAAVVLLGGGIAIVGGTAAQAAPAAKHPNCFTTMPVGPRGAPTLPAPKHCGKNTKPQHRWLTAWA